MKVSASHLKLQTCGISICSWAFWPSTSSSQRPLLRTLASSAVCVNLTSGHLHSLPVSTCMNALYVSTVGENQYKDQLKWNLQLLVKACTHRFDIHSCYQESATFVAHYLVIFVHFAALRQKLGHRCTRSG